MPPPLFGLPLLPAAKYSTDHKKFRCLIMVIMTK
jgi:hypothetical protein